MQPETRYAKSGDINIAYQVLGEGPIDIVFVSGWVSHLDYFWEEPSYARFLRRLASFSRLILFDKRGTGLSDRVSELPHLEQRMDDVRAVMDAVGSERAALLGHSEGGPMSILFAATYPERTSALIMVGSYSRRAWAPDYPWGSTAEEHQNFLDQIERGWGGPVALARRAPSVAGDEWFRHWWARYLRMSASPGAALTLTRMNQEIDVRHVLSTIRVPTLIIHRTNDLTLPVEGARYMAKRIPDARYVELSGADHLPWVADQDAILDEIEEFLTGMRHGGDIETILATVLFTDIVGSTELAAEIGDRRWKELLAAHHALVRQELERFRGREMNTMGDGFLAIFDGPARAIRCACAIATTIRRLGIEIRAGVHTGECRVVEDQVQGLAVHIGARVSALAGPSEVMVSSTVKDLVAGSGIQFESHGTHTLKGVPGEWLLYRVVQEAAPAPATPTAAGAPAQQRSGPLSRREQEVAVLVALGLSNRQIAEELAATEQEIEQQIDEILAKLGYDSRDQIATWATKTGLLGNQQVSSR